MKIAFVVNNERATLFCKIAERLRVAGHEAYWISISHEKSLWLAEQGVDKRTILDITDYGEEWETKSNTGLTDDDRKFLAQFEEHPASMNNIALMDRYLRHKPAAYGLAYLAVGARKIYHFLQSNDIRLVFSEHTWAVEMLVCLICKQLSIHNLNPYLARVPDGRFAFFNSCFQESIEPVREPDASDRRWAEQYVEQFRNKGPKPKYWGATNSIRKFKLRWITKFIARMMSERQYRYQHDENTLSTREIVKDKVSAIINRRTIARHNPFESPDLTAKPARPYLLYALHADIDVLGAQYSNQLELIRTIARSTPMSHDFYVKEHPHSMGNHPIEYYRQIKAIPGVRLISPYADSHALIKHADLVISVSGTIAYEACVYGVAAVTMEKLYFRPLLIQDTYKPYSDSIAELLAKKKEATPGDEQIVDFLAYMHANSFEGEMGDPSIIFTDANIDKMTDGFLTMLNLIGQKENTPEYLNQRRTDSHDYGFVRQAVSH